jgi:predicted ATP-grasp superfamily ATP-dependent carboligase
MEVIILDGNQRSALAATRSLGGKGIKVTVGAETPRSLSSCSRFCAASFQYPAPEKAPELFVSAIKQYVAGKPNSVLLPMTDVSLSEILQKRNEFGQNIAIPFVDYETFHMASDKSQLVKLAQELDIPIPKTLVSGDYKDRESLIEASACLGSPVVIKPALSKIMTENGYISASVRYACNTKELIEVLNDKVFSDYPFIIQERIEGAGIGVFLLMNRGEVIAQFAHRRLREKPPSGGVSVLCESILPHPVALESAVKLLQKLRWHGVAMVEMKEDQRDRIPKLIEVNAHFWGSLQLAISAGVDFPYLLYSLAAGYGYAPCPQYKTGVKSRWELGDLDHLLIRLRGCKEGSVLPNNAPSIVTVIKQFVTDFFNPQVLNEVLRFDDTGPFCYEFKQYMLNLVR